MWRSLIIFLLSLSMYSQSSIIPAGNKTETIGEVFPIMQTIQKESVPLSVPKFEIPIEKPKSIVEKKKSLLQKIILILKNLFK